MSLLLLLSDCHAYVHCAGLQAAKQLQPRPLLIIAGSDSDLQQHSKVLCFDISIHVLLVLQAAKQLQPRPLVVIASSDSDMQQLMDDHTYWLELLQVSLTPQCTSSHVVCT